MKPDTYRVLAMAVRDGAAIGYRRAHKHNENPDEDRVIDAIENPDEDRVIDAIEDAIMGQICEWFKFEDSEAP